MASSTELLGGMIQNESLKLLINCFGYMKGSFTGPIPNRAECLQLLRNTPDMTYEDFYKTLHVWAAQSHNFDEPDPHNQNITWHYCYWKDQFIICGTIRSFILYDPKLAVVVVRY